MIRAWLRRLLGPTPVPEVPGTHVIRIHDDLIGIVARADYDETIRVDWGSPDAHGIYEPTIYRTRVEAA